MLLTAASLLANGVSSDYAVLAVLRAIAGAAGALSLITGGALASAAGGGGGKARPALALGIYFGGAGFGMVVSAIAVPALVAAMGWRERLVRPGRAQLAGDARRRCRHWRAHRMSRRAAHRVRPIVQPHATRGLHALMLSYVLFGAGYIAYTTFIVAYLHNRLRLRRRRRHVVLGLRRRRGDRRRPGLGTIAGAPVRRQGRRRANAVVMLGAVLPVLVATRPRCMSRRCCSAARS